MIQGFVLLADSGLHYDASMDVMEQIHAQRREHHENEMMKRAASGELSDRGALPIYGAVLAMIGLDANRRISAETAVKACQWVALPEKLEGCGVPAYNMAADIAERRRKSERAEAIETAVLVEFARLAARDEYEAASAPVVAVPAPVAKPLQRQPFQEAEILRVLRELGHNPAATPRNKPGRAGPKAAAFGRLGWKKEERGVFDKAWDRLRQAGEIIDA